MNDTSGNDKWVSIDIYYRGVHSKISVERTDGEGFVSPNKLKTVIDAYLDEGFEPSWNIETSKAHKNGGIKDEDPDWIKEETKPSPQSKPGYCWTHSVQMNSYTSKDGTKSWWSHYYITKSGAKIYCSGQGWKNPNAGTQRYIEHPEEL